MDVPFAKISNFLNLAVVVVAVAVVVAVVAVVADHRVQLTDHESTGNYCCCC